MKHLIIALCAFTFACEAPAPEPAPVPTPAETVEVEPVPEDSLEALGEALDDLQETLAPGSTAPEEFATVEGSPLGNAPVVSLSEGESEDIDIVVHTTPAPGAFEAEVFFLTGGPATGEGRGQVSITVREAGRARVESALEGHLEVGRVQAPAIPVEVSWPDGRVTTEQALLRRGQTGGDYHQTLLFPATVVPVEMALPVTCVEASTTVAPFRDPVTLEEIEIERSFEVYIAVTFPYGDQVAGRVAVTCTE